MSLVVMKFGGTSVEDPAAIGRTAAIVTHGGAIRILLAWALEMPWQMMLTPFTPSRGAPPNSE